MASLSGNKIKDTYQSLIKLTDNGNLTTGAKQLTDGFGNNSPLYISTTQIGIGVTPEATFDLHVYQNAKVGGNLTITGDLTVNGTTTTVGTDTLSVKDPLIVLANNNTSADSVDIGFYGKYAPSGTTLYAGLFRDTGDGKFKIFRDLEDEPTTTVNTSGTGYTKADLVIGNLEATGADFTGQVSLPDGSVANPALNFTSDADTGISYDLALKLVFAGAEAVKITSANVDIKPNGTSVLRVDTTGVNFFQDAVFGNDIKTKFGGSSDLQIYHSATGDSYIANSTGDLIINSSGITGTAIKDEDNMASDSASHLATQQSIKAYVDTTTGNYLPLAGGTMSGSIAMGGNNISGGGTATFSSFVGDLTGNADTATALETARTIQVSGDVAGSASFDGTADINISTTIQPNSVVLGTDTTGNYVATISGTTNEIEVSGSGSETAAVTIGLPNDVTVTGELTVSGTGQSSFGGQVTVPATPSASTDAASKGYVDSQVGANNELSEVLANGNTTGGTDIIVSTSDQIFLPDGSATNPAIAFSNDTDSGIYHSGTQFIIAHAGSNKMIIANSQVTLEDRLIVNDTINADDGILIEGASNPYLSIHDETNETYTALWSGDTEAALTFSHSLFRITSSTNNFTGTDLVTITSGGNVGIGTDSPNNFGFLEKAVHINAGTSSDTTLQQAGLVISGSSDADDADDFAYVSFLNNHSTLSNDRVAEIRVLKNGTDVDTGEFAFYTANGTSLNEAMRIDSDGNVGIGTTSNSYTASGRGNLNIAGSSGAILGFQIGGTAKGYVFHDNTNLQLWNESAGNLLFATSATERLRIDSSGNVAIGGSTESDSLLTVRGADTNNKYIRTINNNGTAYFGTIADGTGVLESNTSLKFTTGSSFTERMRIDSLGNVGIGETGARNARLLLNNAGSSGAPQLMLIDSGDSSKQSEIRFDSGNLIFDYWGGTSRSERMRITSGGDVLINKQLAGYPATQGIELLEDGFIRATNTFANNIGECLFLNRQSGTGVLALFRYANSDVGNISTNGTSTAYNTSSDYRLKENVVEMTGALDRVSQLKPSRFNFISDADRTVDGFLAHEVQEIVPEAITGEKDGMRTEEYEESPAVYEEVIHEAQEAIEWENKPTMDNTKVEIQTWLDENSIEWQSADTKQELLDRIPEYQQEAQEERIEQVLVSEAVMATREVPEYQGIDQSKLVPLLVGAIQEQQEIINDLKARIEALEN